VIAVGGLLATSGGTMTAGGTQRCLEEAMWTSPAATSTGQICVDGGGQQLLGAAATAGSRRDARYSAQTGGQRDRR
jgi:hypothetical protein